VFPPTSSQPWMQTSAIRQWGPNISVPDTNFQPSFLSSRAHGIYTQHGWCACPSRAELLPRDLFLKRAAGRICIPC
jgi:hypothetical protein